MRYLRTEVVTMTFVMTATISCGINRAPSSCLADTSVTCACDNGLIGTVKCVDGVFNGCDCPSDAGYESSGNRLEGTVGPESHDSILSTQDRARNDEQVGDAESQFAPTIDTSVASDATLPDAEKNRYRDSGIPNAEPNTIEVDSGHEPKVDAGDEPKVDAGDEPKVDAGHEPKVDAGDDPSGPDNIMTEVYGRCVNESCSGEQECRTVYGGTGTYCTIECSRPEDCPEAPDGTAVRACSYLTLICRLDCDEGRQCPPGMECFSQAGGYYACVWP